MGAPGAPQALQLRPQRQPFTGGTLVCEPRYVDAIIAGAVAMGWWPPGPGV